MEKPILPTNSTSFTPQDGREVISYLTEVLGPKGWGDMRLPMPEDYPPWITLLSPEKLYILLKPYSRIDLPEETIRPIVIHQPPDIDEIIDLLLDTENRVKLYLQAISQYGLPFIANNIDQIRIPDSIPNRAMRKYKTSNPLLFGLRRLLTGQSINRRELYEEIRERIKDQISRNKFLSLLLSPD